MTANKKNNRDTLLIIHMVIFHLNFNMNTGDPQMMLNRISFECVNGEETLRLICRVKDLELGAFIFHNNKEQAFCETFPNISCEDFDENGQIEMISLNDVVYTFGSKKRNFLNGTWACRNGQGARDQSSSIEVVSTKCDFSSPSFNTTMLPYDNNTNNIRNNDDNGDSKIDKVTDGQWLLVLPLVVFGATVAILRYCNFEGCSKPIENERQRSNLEKGCQICCCIFLFGGYCSALFYYNLAIETEHRTVLLIIFCLLGILVSISIPVIWQTRRGCNICCSFLLCGRDGSWLSHSFNTRGTEHRNTMDQLQNAPEMNELVKNTLQNDDIVVV